MLGVGLSGLHVRDRLAEDVFGLVAQLCRIGRRLSWPDAACERLRVTDGLTTGQSCRTTLRSDLLILIPPLYSMNPSLRNLFMKKLTRERVVPTISARIS